MKKRISCMILLGIVMFTSHSSAREVLTFEGELDFLNKNVDVLLKLDEENSVKTKISQKAKNEYHVVFSFDHVKWHKFNFSSDIESSIKITEKKDKQGRDIQGEVWSQFSLVDFKPIRELSGSFLLSDQRLALNSITFGKVNLNGYVNLDAPNRLNLTFNLNAIDMDDFLDFWVKDKKYDSAGPVSGEIKVSGTVKQPHLRGRLQSFDGFVKNLNFDSIHLNIEGNYPRMQVVQSKLSETDGMSYTLDGPINLKDQANFKKQIKALAITPLVQESDSQREWTIKSVGEEKTGRTELKYLLRKNDGVGQDSTEDTAMFGIERSLEF